MTKKDDAEALGGALMKTFSAAVKETVGGEKLTGNAKVLNELLEEIAGQNQSLTLHIFRKGVGVNAANEEYLTPMYNVSPEMLRETGVEPLIQGYCGGGTYRIRITASNGGVPPRVIQGIVIAGEPLAPKPERDAKNMAMMPPMMGAAGLGYNAGAPGAAQLLGLPANYALQQQQPSNQSHMQDMLLAQLMSAMLSKQQSSTDNDEMKALRAQLEELKMQKAAADADRARIESERRSDAQIAALKAEMEKLAAAASAPKEDKVLSVIGQLGPTLVAYFKDREQMQQLQAQNQAAAAREQMNLVIAMLGTQKDASKESLELIKAVAFRPQESETDRMKSIMDIAASSMSTTMGLSQSLINQMAALQPGEKPFWQEALMNVIAAASEMGQMALESRSQKVTPPAKQIGPIEGRPVGEGEQPQGMLGAAAAAAAAAQESLATPPPDGMMPAEEGSVAGMQEAAQETPPELPDFSAGAYKLIFEKISDKQDGDVHEIAFRIWKHASSGDKAALIWVRNPEEYTFYVLDSLAQQGLLLVTAERMEEMADAMVELFEHFRSGGDAAAYVKKYALTISEPKKLVVVPLPPRQPGEVDYPDEEGARAEQPVLKVVGEAEVAVEPPAKAEETPKAPVVATPSFGSAPPPKQVVQPNVPTPGIDAVQPPAKS